MYITDESLKQHESLRHGFFTRNGGISEGIYAALNCGIGSRDRPAHIRENRAIAAQVMGAQPEALLTLYQIHSAQVITVTDPWPANTELMPKADAMVTKTPGLVLGILTADCAPVLFADPQAGVIGAAHAGWKGALAGIIENTLEAMEALGADRARISAAIGPAIGQESYETGPEFIINFRGQDPDSISFFAPAARKGHNLFDLPRYVKHRLTRAGTGAVNLLAQDTCLDENSFFSYRRATLRGEEDYGRQLSAIRLME